MATASSTRLSWRDAGPERRHAGDRLDGVGNVYKASLQRSTKLRNLYVNDARAAMTSKTVSAKGGSGTYSVTAGQAAWAWASGSNSDGVKYATTDVPAIASNKNDLEIVNGTTWNENIVCVRDVTTSSDNYRVLLLQQPYGAIAQLPGWSSGFSTTGTHTIYNAYEFLNSPGQFYFDKTAGTLYYYPRSGENMSTADVEAPVVDELIDIAGTSTTNRVKNLTFQGLTFENTDWELYSVAGSSGKATVQGATVYIAYGDGNWHNSRYEITDTLPGMINVTSADSINFVGNVVKHSGSEGISMINDVDQLERRRKLHHRHRRQRHHRRTSPARRHRGRRRPREVRGGRRRHLHEELISNNVLYDISMLPGFGGHAGITAFFVDTLSITNNHIQTTAYNGINLGWGWSNFPTSTTSKNNAVNNNRLIDTLSRLHDSGAVYTLGQMPGTTVNQNYVRGIPANTSGPTYGLHNDEGSAYITENDNVLDISTGVTYTINCEDLRRQARPDGAAHVRHRQQDGRQSAQQHDRSAGGRRGQRLAGDPVRHCLKSGVQDQYRAIFPSGLIAPADYVLPASVAVAVGTATLPIRSSGNASNALAGARGHHQFAAGATMTQAAGDATAIAVPSSAGTYKLSIVDSSGNKLGESAAPLRVK